MSQPSCTYYELDKQALANLMRRNGFVNAMRLIMKRWHKAGCPVDRDGDIYTHRKGWERSRIDDDCGNIIFEWRIKGDDDD